MKYELKLIWRFSGQDSEKIASHHLSHLIEYSTKNKILINNKGTEKQDDYTSISFIIIYNNLIEKIKQDLKPHFIIKIGS